MKILADRITTEWVSLLTGLTPDSGCYMSEARRGTFITCKSPANHTDRRIRNSQTGSRPFFGSNYDSLYAIKTKYDPFRTFYAPTAAGSDEWQVQADGRLCQARIGRCRITYFGLPATCRYETNSAKRSHHPARDSAFSRYRIHPLLSNSITYNSIHEVIDTEQRAIAFIVFNWT
jgi:hypothetical protein